MAPCRGTERDLWAVSLLATAGLLLMPLVSSHASGETVAAERGVARLAIDGTIVSIEYGRPSLQGRDPLSLATIGRPWRLGKDADTTLRTNSDLWFHSLRVIKGKYFLTALPVAPEEWRLVFRDAERGSYGSVPFQLTKTEGQAVELLTITLVTEQDDGVLAVRWGGLTLSAAFTIGRGKLTNTSR